MSVGGYAQRDYDEAFEAGHAQALQEIRDRGVGAQRISGERKRQIEREGWSAEHDDEHKNGELRDAAACYLTLATDRWPWSLADWKPSDAPIRNLVKAGALIAAEIDRLERKAARSDV